MEWWDSRRKRLGSPYQPWSNSGKVRVLAHCGADDSGAPKGEGNGNYKHGCYTKRWPPGVGGYARLFIAQAAKQAPLTSPARAILPYLHRDHLLGAVDGMALLD